MAETVTVLRPHRPAPIDNFRELYRHRPPCRSNGEALPLIDSVCLNAIEYCVGCGHKMTVANLEAWLCNDQGQRVRRLGPCHPNCRDMIRFDHRETIEFVLPARG